MRFAALLCLFAFPVMAQNTLPETLTDQAAIGRLVITNHSTEPTDRTTTYTINGLEVVVYYRSTPNDFEGVDPRDVINITVPEGYVAIPSEALLPEGEVLEVLIYEALLG